MFVVGGDVAWNHLWSDYRDSTRLDTNHMARNARAYLKTGAPLTLWS